ncbi:hypothetical protein U3516DRAFT_887168 [Neocallimastix sp. 'constans']
MIIIVVLLLLAPIPTKVTIIDVLIRVFSTIITAPSPYSHDLCYVTCFGILLLLPNIPLVRINTACLC